MESPGSRLALNYYLAHAGLELAAILLPQPPECWDYRHSMMHLVNSAQPSIREQRSCRNGAPQSLLAAPEPCSQESRSSGDIKKARFSAPRLAAEALRIFDL